MAGGNEFRTNRLMEEVLNSRTLWRQFSQRMAEVMLEPLLGDLLAEILKYLYPCPMLQDEISESPIIFKIMQFKPFGVEHAI